MNSRRSWRRWVLVGAACFLAGGVLAVLTAWAGVLWWPRPEQAREVEKVWPRAAPAGWPERPDVVHLARDAFASGYVANATRPGLASGMENRWTLQVIAAGWPLRAVEWRMHADGAGGRINSVQRTGIWEASDRIPVPGDPGARRWLPVKPMWAGLVVDAGVWGVLCHGVVAAPFALRRWMRRRRGACVGCGYDLRGLSIDAACPECGRGRS